MTICHRLVTVKVMMKTLKIQFLGHPTQYVINSREKKAGCMGMIGRRKEKEKMF